MWTDAGLEEEVNKRGESKRKAFGKFSVQNQQHAYLSGECGAVAFHFVDACGPTLWTD